MPDYVSWVGRALSSLGARLMFGANSCRLPRISRSDGYFRILIVQRSSPLHSSGFLHSKEIFCHFGSLLVNFGHLQLTTIIIKLYLRKWWRSNIATTYFPACTTGPKGNVFVISWLSSPILWQSQHQLGLWLGTSPHLFSSPVSSSPVHSLGSFFTW